MKAMWWCGLSLLGLGGCQAQADSDYQGEPLLTVSGKVVTGTTVPTEAMDVAVLWEPRKDSTHVVGTTYTIARAKVTGSFPSAFTLNVFDPPPGSDDPAYDSQAAWGHVVAIPSDSPVTTNEPEYLGGAIGVVVAYFPRDADPEDPYLEFFEEAKALGVEPVKGFHLARYVVDSEEAEAEWLRCQNPNGLCTNLIDRSADVWSQRASEGDFNRCRKYVPNASTCNIYEIPETPVEEAETASCRILWQAQRDVLTQNEAAGIQCASPYRYESLEGEHAAPLTVTLGVGGLELLVARAWE